MEQPNIPHTDSGPRERLQMYGAPSLSDSELVAVVLGTGHRDQPVQVLAARLLQCAGSVRGLADPRRWELSGLGPTKEGRLRAALELGVRAAAHPLSAQRPIRSSRDVDSALGPALRGAETECFLAVALDAKNRPIRQVTVALGGVSSCALTPADAFRPIVREAAAGALFVHNHPSGEPAPSDEDVAMTRRLQATGELLGVRVLDHVIIGGMRYFSFLDAGLLHAGSDRGA